jgi:hypothetical protein
MRLIRSRSNGSNKRPHSGDGIPPGLADFEELFHRPKLVDNISSNSNQPQVRGFKNAEELISLKEWNLKEKK